MEDECGNVVTLIDLSGEKRHEDAAARLCSHCLALLERVRELEAGSEKKYQRGKFIAKDQPIIKDSSNPDFQTWQEFEELPEDNSLPHKAVRSELLASSERGCTMCTWLMQSLQFRQGPNGQHDPAWSKRAATVEEPGGRLSCTSHYKLTVRCPARSNNPTLVGSRSFQVLDRTNPSKREQSYNSTFREAELAVPYGLTRDDESALLYVDALPRSSSTNRLLGLMRIQTHISPSPATWAILAEWLRNCDEEHHECAETAIQSTEQVLPGRLIDIRDAEKIRVVSNLAKHDRLKYATLSYCWGSSQEPKLTEQSSNTWADGVSLGRLPRLFIDVIKLARFLDIPYLWIDSLCIRQDCPQDWAKESSIMGAIYARSYLCIAATCSGDNQSAILHPRPLKWQQPLIIDNLVIQCDVAIAYPSIEHNRATLCNRICSISEGTIANAPLNRRAWALQERLLAPRIIHCTASEFTWECCKGMKSESHPTFTSVESGVKQLRRQIHESIKMRSVSPRDGPSWEEKMRLLGEWKWFRRTLSTKGMTFQQDKLPACSAVAKLMQPSLGAYSAGLWTAFMPRQLLWSFSEHFYGDLNKTIFASKIPSFRPARHNQGPSWSWRSASVDTNPGQPRRFGHQYFMPPPGSDDRASTRTYIKILDIDVGELGKDEFGAARSGRIDLQCSLFPIYRDDVASNGQPLLSLKSWTGSVGLDDIWADDADNKFPAGGRNLQYLAGLEFFSVDERENNAHREQDDQFLSMQRSMSTANPALTALCFLPVSSAVSVSRTSRGSGPTIVRGEWKRKRYIGGLLLEHTGEPGVYRRLGTMGHAFEPWLEGVVGCGVGEAVPLNDCWPSRRSFSPQNGFEISII